jgi:kinesin family protein 2/24
MDDLRKLKVEREQLNEAQGIKVDVDFQAMVENHMRNVTAMRPHIPADELKICVCVKKRPVFMNELANGEIDCVSVSNPVITVHECKFKVDGITKFVDNSEFIFDNSFSHLESNEELYNYSI